jgi:hypothetical protein
MALETQVQLDIQHRQQYKQPTKEFEIPNNPLKMI